MTEGQIDREPLFDVALALQSELQRFGAERMIQSLDIVDRVLIYDNPADAVNGPHRSESTVVLVALREIDEPTRRALRHAAENGVKILLLVDPDEICDFRRLASVRCAGIVITTEMNSHTLRIALERIRDGELWMPTQLTRCLLERAVEPLVVDEIKAAPRLTAREQEVLQPLVDGLSNRQIARRLGISEHGAKRLVANVLAKLDCTNRTLAVATVLRHGLYDRHVGAN